MAFFINCTDEYKDWEKIYHYYLENCDSFIVCYPNGDDPKGDNPLLEGKKEFERLPDIEKKPWSAMDDSIEIKGKLTEKSIQIFKNHTESSLWHFTLLKQNEKLLKVEDFTVCFVADRSDIIEELKVSQKIDLTELDNIEYDFDNN